MRAVLLMCLFESVEFVCFVSVLCAGHACISCVLVLNQYYQMYLCVDVVSVFVFTFYV